MLAVAVEGQPVALSLAEKTACEVVSAPAPTPTPAARGPGAAAARAKDAQPAEAQVQHAPGGTGRAPGPGRAMGAGGEVTCRLRFGVHGEGLPSPVHLPGLLQVTSLHGWGSC